MTTGKHFGSQNILILIYKGKKSKQDTTGANLAWNKEKVKEAGITEEEKD